MTLMPAPVTLRKFLLLVLFSTTVVLYSQAQDTLQTDSLLLDECLAGSRSPKIIPMPYGMETNEDISPLPVAYLQAEDFNQGNIQDPMHLLQGRIAGLTIARAGNDPNEPFDVRVRGIAALNGPRSPLIVVDGFPAADLLTIDPQDIASVTVLRGSAATAIYGLRGLPGVIQIETQKGEAGNTVIRYQGSVSAELLSRQAEMADVPTFLELGGENLGHRTDWVDEITRTGLAHIHSLSLSGGNGGTTYRASGHYRKASGILRGSGFQRFNGRASVQQTALDDRLKVSATVSAASQDSDLGFPEAFRYAHIFNPTAPVFNPGADSLGGYYETEQFDVYNPVSVISQSVHQEQKSIWAANFSAGFEIIKGLTLNSRYAVQQSDRIEGQAFLASGLYFGKGRNGYAARATQSHRSELLETTLRYNHQFSNQARVQAVAGYSRQNLRSEGTWARKSDFRGQPVSFNDMQLLTLGSTHIGSFESYNGATALEAGFAALQLSLAMPLTIYSTLRYERLPLFDRDNDWQAYPSIGASYDFSSLMSQNNKIDALTLRVSYGLAGGTPSAEPLVEVPLENYPATISPLAAELGETFDLGLHFSAFNRRLMGALNFFRSETSNFLNFVYANAPNYPGRFNFWERDAQFITKGAELELQWAAVRSSVVKWNIAAVAATARTRLENYGLPAKNVGVFGPPVISSLTNRLILHENGALMGQMWGPVYAGLNENGTYQFEDQNGNGVYMTGGEDNTVLGNAQPTLTLGLGNQLTWKRFDFNVFFRGIFGHDLINANRAVYGSAATIDRYNVAVDGAFNSALAEPAVFNSTHVEKASFLRLDNTTLGYQVKLGNDTDRLLRVFGNAQNLFTITSYTGVDPEVRYTDGGGTGNAEFAVSDNVLAWGIDRRNTYLPARTFTFGVELKL